MSADKPENRPYALIIVEGMHDLASIVRILRLLGFSEIQKLSSLPPFAKSMIPTRYPLSDGMLRRLIPHPTFLQNEIGYIVIANANGQENLGRELFRLLGPAHDSALAMLRAVAILSDMDENTAADNQNDIQRQLDNQFGSAEAFRMDTFLSGSVQVKGRTIPSFLYLLPDQNHSGTLEAILLAGAERSYPDLLNEANYFINSVDAQKYSLKKFDSQKATVGVISNVLRPGGPNQSSIFDEDWFTSDSLQEVPLHRQFSEFLKSILQTLT